VVVLTRCDQVPATDLECIRERVARLAPGVPVALTTHRPVALVNGDRATAPLERLTQRPVAAFCGIGNPAAFGRTLTDAGAAVAAWRTFPDHHAYTRADVEALTAWARQQATECMVVTTQKDLVKLRLARLGGRELWAVRVELHVTAGRPEFDRKLKEALG
jgi:tetraacyldisaccharide 4'-kinase